MPQIARAVHEHALVPLGAAGSSLGVCDTAQPGMIRIRSTIGFPPDTTARYDRLPLDADLPGPAVLRTGRRWSCATRAEIAAQFPDALPILAGTDYAAAAVLPLGPTTHVMGYLAVRYPDQRRLSGGDWALLTAIADQTAHAVRRGQLAENEARQRARAERSERGQRLAGEVAARLECTPRPEQRMQELVDALVPAIADFATLELPTDAGVPRLAAVAHREPSAVTGLRALREHHALSPNDPCSVAQVLRTGRTVTLPDLCPALINQFSLGHDALRLLTVLQPRSLLIVPLIADRQVLGVLLLGYSTSGAPRGRPLTLLEAVRVAPEKGDDPVHGLGTDDNPIFDRMHEASCLVCGGWLLAAREIAGARATLGDQQLRSERREQRRHHA